MKRLLLYFVAAAVLVSALPTYAEVWGVKSLWPNTELSSVPPCTLFHFAEDGSEFMVVAPVTLNGDQIDVDGLAMDRSGTLYGFQVGIGGSRLVRMDKATAEATVAGPVLANRDIRGAVCAWNGQLVALDACYAQVLAIDAATGNATRPGMPLTLGGNAFDLYDCADIAQRPDGTYIVTGTAEADDIGPYHFYTLDITSGQLMTTYTDPDVGWDGYVLQYAGIAFSASATNTLIAYDIRMQDDIYAYNLDTGYTRTTLYPHIIPDYNAGRGDLASEPVSEPSALIVLACGMTILCTLARRSAASHP